MKKRQRKKNEKNRKKKIVKFLNEFFDRQNLNKIFNELDEKYRKENEEYNKGR